MMEKKDPLSATQDVSDDRVLENEIDLEPGRKFSEY